MNYLDSIKDFFRSPKWGMNILLGGVCMLIPLIGQIVLSGWNITQFWGQGDQKDPTKLPEFSFNHFVKYLTRGLWPFLVQLVIGLVLVIVIVVGAFVCFFIIAALATAMADAAAPAFTILLLIGIPIYLMLMIGLNLILVPITLKATLTQDFGAAFDLSFVKSFLSNVWKEIVVTALFMFVLGIAFTIATLILFIPTLGFGVYFLIPVMSFAWQHLVRQLYVLHLKRDGIAVTLSPKLNDLPPALPL